MADYTIQYFDFPGGRGEDARLALHIAGASFEDDRVNFSRWTELRAETPFGALPTLRVEGRDDVLAQSTAILVFLGRSLGMHPEDLWRAAHHEAIMQSVEDLRHRVAESGKVEGPEKEAARKGLAAGWMNDWAKHVDGLISGPYIEGDELHVADLKLFNIMRWFVNGGVDHIPTDYFDAFENLSAFFDAVGAHPKVVEWYRED